MIGSSPKADLRITGDGVQGCHVVLRYKHPQWFVCDCEQLERSRPERPIDEQTVLHIGRHQLRLVRQAAAQPLFKNSNVDAHAKLTMHQVVVLRKDRVIDTRLLACRSNIYLTQRSRAYEVRATDKRRLKVSDVEGRPDRTSTPRP